MLVPLLALPVTHPLANLLVQGFLDVFCGLAAFFLLARYMLRESIDPLVGALGATAFLILAPAPYRFDYLMDVSYGVWLTLGLGGLIVAEPEPGVGARTWGRRLVALVLDRPGPLGLWRDGLVSRHPGGLSDRAPGRLPATRRAVFPIDSIHHAGPGRGAQPRVLRSGPRTGNLAPGRRVPGREGVDEALDPPAHHVREDSAWPSGRTPGARMVEQTRAGARAGGLAAGTGGRRPSWLDGKPGTSASSRSHFRAEVSAGQLRDPLARGRGALLHRAAGRPLHGHTALAEAQHLRAALSAAVGLPGASGAGDADRQAAGLHDSWPTGTAGCRS